jgi:hypothetical protein
MSRHPKILADQTEKGARFPEKSMKTILPAGFPVLSLFLVRRLTLGLVAVLSPLVFADDPTSNSAAIKTHTLFMGADLSLEQSKEIYRVQGVDGGSFLIMVKGKEVRVPMDRGMSKLKIDSSLKLTESLAIVANLKGERSYTRANDPTVRFLDGMNQAEQLKAGNEAAHNQADAGFKAFDDSTAENVYVASKDPFSHPTPISQKTKYLAVTQAKQDLTNFTQNVGKKFEDAEGNPLTFEGDFDAIDVAFEVSSERPLNSPYVVIVAQYRVTAGRPGQIGNWIYSRSLDAIGREVRKIHIEQGGLPQGFELVDLQLHLYNHGEEIATTVAPKRVMLSRDEAFQYVMVEYVSSHKGATLPATPAMGKLPGDLSTRLANGQLKPTYYVKVSKDGKASDLYADESCTEKVDDPYLDTVIRNLRFKPALDRGKPVDGVAVLKLGQLPI